MTKFHKGELLIAKDLGLYGRKMWIVSKIIEQVEGSFKYELIDQTTDERLRLEVSNRIGGSINSVFYKDKIVSTLSIFSNRAEEVFESVGLFIGDQIKASDKFRPITDVINTRSSIEFKLDEDKGISLVPEEIKVYLALSPAKFKRVSSNRPKDDKTAEYTPLEVGHSFKVNGKKYTIVGFEQSYNKNDINKIKSVVKIEDIDYNSYEIPKDLFNLIEKSYLLNQSKDV